MEAREYNVNVFMCVCVCFCVYVSDVYYIGECAAIHAYAKESAIGQFSPHLRNLFVDLHVILVQCCVELFSLFLY